MQARVDEPAAILTSHPRMTVCHRLRLGAAVARVPNGETGSPLISVALADWVVDACVVCSATRAVLRAVLRLRLLVHCRENVEVGALGDRSVSSVRVMARVGKQVVVVVQQSGRPATGGELPLGQISPGGLGTSA